MATPARPNLRSLLGLVALLVAVWGGHQLLSTWQDARAATAIREHSQRVDLTVYTTTSCPYCAKAISWLRQHGVRWRECNIETDSNCQRVFEQRGAPGVPLLQAGERWHLGFHPPWLAEALAAQDAEDAAQAAQVPANASTRSITGPQAVSPSGASSPRP